MTVAGRFLQEQEDDEHDEHEREQQRELHVHDRVLDRLGAVVDDLQLDRGGELLVHRGEHPLHLARDLHRVRARLAAHRDGDAALVLAALDEPGGDAVVLHPVLHLAEVGEPHRRAVAERDHHVAEVRRGEEPAGRLDGVGAIAPLDDAGGQVRVGVADRRRHLLEADAPRSERARVELDAHRVLLRAEDRHLRDARHGRDTLRHEVHRVAVDLGERQGGRGEGEIEDGLVRRVHLPEGRRVRHRRGERPQARRRSPPGRRAPRSRCRGRGRTRA